MYSAYPRDWVRPQGGLVAKSMLWMAAGLVVTLAVAAAITATLRTWLPFYTGWGPLVLALGEIALVWYLSSRLQRGTIAPAEGRALFLLYAASFGVLIVPALVAAPGTVGPAVLLSAGTFTAAGLWGAATGVDMRPLGTFLFMALIGLLLAMAVNALLIHGALTFWISLAGVLLFSGLTAYDVGRIRGLGWAGEGAAILGALTLYLDFANLFLFWLMLLGGRRR
jgi:FtsH-binding integral membrane protein